jgi:hypothetical protein
MSGAGILEHSHNNKWMWLGWCTFVFLNYAIPAAALHGLASKLGWRDLANWIDTTAKPALAIFALSILAGWHWWSAFIGLAGIIAVILATHAMRRAGRTRGAGARANLAARHSTGHEDADHGDGHGDTAHH